jgi:hypothetical protein
MRKTALIDLTSGAVIFGAIVTFIVSAGYGHPKIGLGAAAIALLTAFVQVLITRSRQFTGAYCPISLESYSSPNSDQEKPAHSSLVGRI